MRIILLGAPGAGKGTQAVLLAEEFSLPHVSTGEYFRRIIAEKTDLGLLADSYISKGFLVPDDVVMKIVAERLEKPDCRNGFILDGFPRTLFQAAELKKLYKIDYCVHLDIEPGKLIARILGRRVCIGCGKNFHTEFYGKDNCETCGGMLKKREDDNEKTVSARLSVYAESTKPLIEFYKKEGILVDINGGQQAKKVFSDIKEVIK